MSEKLIKEIEIDDELDECASVAQEPTSGRCSATEIARHNSAQSVQTPSQNSMPVPTGNGTGTGSRAGSGSGSGNISGLGSGSGSGNGSGPIGTNGTAPTSANGNSNPRISIDSGKDSGKYLCFIQSSASLDHKRTTDGPQMDHGWTTDGLSGESGDQMGLKCEQIDGY